MSQFLPISLASLGETISLHEAISWLAAGVPHTGSDVYCSSDGDIRFKAPPGFEGLNEDETFTRMRSLATAEQEATSEILVALSAGCLRAYVVIESGNCYKISIAEWGRFSPDQFGRQAYTGFHHQHELLNERPLLLSNSAFHSWRDGRVLFASVPLISKLLKRPAARPGPPIDRQWRDKVFKFCALHGADGIGSGVSAREFLRMVKEHYRLGRDDKPIDARRTDIFRQSWLDEKAGVSPRH